jgi:hypothetical protein
MKNLINVLKPQVNRICDRLLSIPYEERKKMPFDGFIDEAERQEFRQYVNQLYLDVKEIGREYFGET